MRCARSLLQHRLFSPLGRRHRGAVRLSHHSNDYGSHSDHRGSNDYGSPDDHVSSNNHRGQHGDNADTQDYTLQDWQDVPAIPYQQSTTRSVRVTVE